MQTLRNKEPVAALLRNRQRNIREDFDERRDFACTRTFTLGGVTYKMNDTLQKDQLTVRRLRQLYDHRYIRMLPWGVEEASAKTDVIQMPAFASMQTEALEVFLQSNNVVPRIGSSRDVLLKKAIQTWNRMSEEKKKAVLENASPPNSTPNQQ